jgi:hypothetical protein
MEALRLLDFVTVALKRSGHWMLVLDFWPTDDEEADWSSLSWTLPWLAELGDDCGRVCDELRRHGLALVSCAGEEEARRLLDQIQGFRVGATVFTDRGENTQWGLAGNPRKGVLHVTAAGARGSTCLAPVPAVAPQTSPLGPPRR